MSEGTGDARREESYFSKQAQRMRERERERGEKIGLMK